jgi:DNA ligase-1
MKLLESIELTSSRYAKEQYLAQGKDNDKLKTLLKLANDPFKLFYIKKMPTYSESNTTPRLEDNYKDFLGLVEKLSNREITGNSAIEGVKLFLSLCNNEESKWYSRVIQKDLKIGATVKTINKVFGEGFIPEFNVQLADKLKSLEGLPSLFYVEDKLDGMRIIAYNYGVGAVLMSRNGKQVLGFDDIEKSLRYLPSGYVYDGEIMSGKFNNLMTKAFKKQSKGKSGVLNIFDVLPMETFENRGTSLPQIERKMTLDSFFRDIPKDKVLSIAAVKSSRVFKKSEKNIEATLNNLYKDALVRGFEGIMIKNSISRYQFKRTDSILKLKPEDKYDLEVVDILEGSEDSKYVGMLGAVVVDFNGELVHVGSGFKDEERKEFWEKPNLIVGKTIMVAAQETTTNKRNTISLRFPVYKGLRLDK